MEPRAPLKVAHPPPRAVMLFDEDCSFCRRWAGRWRSITGDVIDYEPGQTAGKRFPEIAPEALAKAVHLVETDGTVRAGGAAALRAFALAGKERWAWWVYCHFAVFAILVEMAYRFVERHRGGFLDSLDRWMLGNRPEWPRWQVGRWAFLRGIGFVYLIAFVDFWKQADGLIGSGGILPIGEFLNAVRVATHTTQWHYLPTICWLNSSDAFLRAMCLSGCIAAVLLILNILPLGASIIAWVLYLSLVTAGQIFFELQWDALLLEAGLLAILYVPIEPWPRLGKDGEPPWITRWLLRWLLFRVMFLSGLVKILSHDATWANFTALNYHYWTQPLPPWPAWYMAKLPQWFEKLSVFFVFVAELLCPVLILGPRRFGRWGLAGIVTLQGLILATGNYGFFNLLVLVLCLPMIEDASAFWKWVPGGKWLVRRASPHGNPAAAPRRGAGPDEGALARPGWILAPIAIFLVFLSVMAARRSFLPEAEPPTRLEATANYFAPFQIANSYGLFAIMTTDRPEIIVSGSDDGVHWTEYPFKYKPGDVRRRPRFCTPWMPRLDWRMWFMALDDEQAGPNGWDGTVLELFLRRLLHASPSVVGLLADNPFPGHPPKFVRADLFQYRFTTVAEKRATGDWWHREFQSPIIELSREPQR
ncbi:MAG TPA: lipase maturation factor family protein [Tepidisphaeraceae bacterium]|nr:lipase maturation factor family protein [Tepidisphaeraceae bacterium]